MGTASVETLVKSITNFHHEHWPARGFGEVGIVGMKAKAYYPSRDPEGFLWIPKRLSPGFLWSPLGSPAVVARRALDSYGFLWIPKRCGFLSGCRQDPHGFRGFLSSCRLDSYGYLGGCCLDSLD